MTYDASRIAKPLPVHPILIDERLVGSSLLDDLLGWEIAATRDVLAWIRLAPVIDVHQVGEAVEERSAEGDLGARGRAQVVLQPRDQILDYPGRDQRAGLWVNEAVVVDA